MSYYLQGNLTEPSPAELAKLAEEHKRASLAGLKRTIREKVIGDVMIGTPLQSALDIALKFDRRKAVAKILFDIANELDDGSDEPTTPTIKPSTPRAPLDENECLFGDDEISDDEDDDSVDDKTDKKEEKQ